MAEINVKPKGKEATSMGKHYPYERTNIDSFEIQHPERDGVKTMRSRQIWAFGDYEKRKK